MTPEQAAAYIQSQTAMMLCELEYLKSRGESSLYWHYEELQKKWEPVLGCNAVTQLFNESNEQ